MPPNDTLDETHTTDVQYTRISRADPCKTNVSLVKLFGNALVKLWWNLPFAGDRRVPGHGLGRNLEIRVGPIQERLAALWQVLQYQPGGRRRAATVQRRSAGARAGSIFHVKAANRQDTQTVKQTSDDGGYRWHVKPDRRQKSQHTCVHYFTNWVKHATLRSLFHVCV